MTLNGIPHYYPIMLLKQGELDAVSKVNRDWDKWYTPIFNVVPDSFWQTATETVNGRKKRVRDERGNLKRIPKDFRDTVENLSRGLHENWRHEFPLFLDGQLLTGRIAGNFLTHPIYDLIEAIVEKEMSVIPVSGLNSQLRNRDYQQAIQTWIKMDKKGLCLRLHPENLKQDSVQQDIDTALDFFGVSEADVYLLLDFGYIDTKISFVEEVVKLPYLKNWKRIIVGSGAFPKNEQNKVVLKPNSSPRFNRHDLLSWIDTVKSPKLASLRKIEFADYTCRNPDFVPLSDMKNRPAAKITWTLDREFVHERGTQPKRGDNQFTDLAENLCAQSGVEEGLMPSICDADKLLKSIFDGTPDRKVDQRLPFWIGKSAEHHITLTVLQMLDLAGYGIPEKI